MEVSEKERVIAGLTEAYWHDCWCAKIIADEAYDAGYRQGIEDAANVANEAAAEYSASSKQIGDYHHAKAVAANSIAAAIRALGKEGK